MKGVKRELMLIASLILNDPSCLVYDASIYIRGNHDLLPALQFFKHSCLRYVWPLLVSFIQIHKYSFPIDTTTSELLVIAASSIYDWHPLLISKKGKKNYGIILESWLVEYHFYPKPSWVWVLGPCDIYHKLAKKKRNLSDLFNKVSYTFA